MSLDKAIIIGLAVLLLAASGVALWQRAEIKEYAAEKGVWEASNKSLVQEAEVHFKYIDGQINSLQACLDSKTKLAHTLYNVRQKLSRATPTDVQKDKVVDDESLKYIIDRLNKPLPAANSSGL